MCNTLKLFGHEVAEDNGMFAVSVADPKSRATLLACFNDSKLPWGWHSGTQTILWGALIEREVASLLGAVESQG
jgi:hypothetical protein